MSDTLVLAIPSKGRLMEAAEETFAEAGYKVSRSGGDRRYSGRLEGADTVEVRFLSAGEIAAGLMSGDIHLGLTGRDLLHERVDNPDEKVLRLQPLGFGHADVVVAVPDAWFDVETMADLAEVAAELRHEQGRLLRVATKFTNMTRSFFARHGIADYRIVESLGATEGAPAAGTADIIVDITTTGATLTANHLRILDDGLILRSEAFLCASLDANWSRSARCAVEEILARLAARAKAKTFVEVRCARKGLSTAHLVRLLAERGASIAYGGADESGEEELTVHCPKITFHELAANLKAAGAPVISARTVDFIYEKDNPLSDALFQALEG